MAVFPGVVVGVDGTDAALDAVQQGRRLADPGTKVVLVCAVDLAKTVHAGAAAGRLADDLTVEGEAALDAAVAIVGGDASRRLVTTSAVHALRTEAARAHAALLAVGSHGHRRATEILIGGVAGELIHASPCSVLLARPAGDDFPRSIVVGVDGSPCSERALAAARGLAERCSAKFRVVVATGGKHVDLVHARELAPELEELDGRPVDVLNDAAAGADLLVVGSRGLHGARALGSVSERVAHQASCSVLVVRDAESG